VFRFLDLTADDVMTPRVDVIAVSETESIETARTVRAEHRLTRLLVYRETVDETVGYVDLRDLVTASDDTLLSSLVRPLTHVSETRPVDKLLAELQDDRFEVATVVDEFGAVEGPVTVEDFVEQLVGDILDVEEEPSVLPLDEGVVSTRGDATLAAVGAALDIRPPDGGSTVLA
jgi:CBS domain containing-hemolysin-like protein